MRKQELKVKDINLLEVYKKTVDVKVYAPWIKYTIPPILITLVLGSVYGFMMFQNHQLGNENSATTAEIAKLKEEALNDPKAKKYEEIQNLKALVKTIEDAYAKIATYPILKTEIFQAITNNTYADMKVTSFTYASETQMITMQIETTTANGSEAFVRRLKDSDVFQTVSYSGYSGIQKDNTTSEAVDTENMTSEQLLEYFKNTTTSPTTITYDAYTATVTCTLK